MRPRIAVTLGDPRGIGPEVVARALETPVDAEVTILGADDQVGAVRADHHIGLGTWGLGSGENLPASPGPSRMVQAGRIAGHAIERAAALALAGEVDAIVTGPVHKHALHQAGFPWPGHTEWLAELAGGVDVAMMLASERLRVVLVTTHVALRDVPSLVTQERVVRAGRITQRALREWFGVAEPRLAVCALNPHAGEGGLFGDEEERVLRPAAKALGAAGPLPADTVFVRAMRGEFDAVLAPVSRRGDDRHQGGVVRPRGERDARPAVSAHQSRPWHGARHRGHGAGGSGEHAGGDRTGGAAWQAGLGLGTETERARFPQSSVLSPFFSSVVILTSLTRRPSIDTISKVLGPTTIRSPTRGRRPSSPKRKPPSVV